MLFNTFQVSKHFHTFDIYNLHFICFKNKDIYYITKDMEQKWQNTEIWQTWVGKGIVSFLLKTPGLWEEQ